MGQPIHLVKDGEKLTVYGPNQAQIMLSQGWKPVGDEPEEGKAFVPMSTYHADDLTAIDGVGPAVAAVLADAGYRTYSRIAQADDEDLVALDKISSGTVKKIKASAAALAAEMS